MGEWESVGGRVGHLSHDQLRFGINIVKSGARDTPHTPVHTRLP